MGKNHVNTVFSHDTQVPHYWVFIICNYSVLLRWVGAQGVGGLQEKSEK